jgi:hypothetical protein
MPSNVNRSLAVEFRLSPDMPAYLGTLVNAGAGCNAALWPVASFACIADETVMAVLFNLSGAFTRARSKLS